MKVICRVLDEITTCSFLENIGGKPNNVLTAAGSEIVGSPSGTLESDCIMVTDEHLKSLFAHVDKNYRVFHQSWLDSQTLYHTDGLRVTLNTMHVAPADAWRMHRDRSSTNNDGFARAPGFLGGDIVDPLNVTATVERYGIELKKGEAEGLEAFFGIEMEFGNGELSLATGGFKNAVEEEMAGRASASEGTARPSIFNPWA
ncbi:hypothetical protein HK101_008493 [Irineochytrium annulatum]|nr:hypothetical protein HK101_008493 [Irineochytrium annulatum]